MPSFDRAALLAELERDEGLRLKPYRDSVGKLTLGIGRNLDDVGISRGEALALLDNDIARSVLFLNANIPWWSDLSDVRRRVMLNMCFNLGGAGLLEFRRFLAALASGDYANAAAQMLDSAWARQVGARAERLAMMIRTDKALADLPTRV